MLNKHNVRIIIFLLAILFLTSCNTTLSKDEYVKWLRDEKNGLNKKKEIGEYIFEAQYKPIEFLELNNNSNDNSFKKNKTKGDGTIQYFDLKIKHKDGTDFIKSKSEGSDDFQNRMYYFSFAFQNDLKIEEDTTTYNCVLYHFERSYGLDATKTFVLGFERPSKDYTSDKILVIDSRELGVGTVKIKFKKEDLENIPKVNYE